MNFSKIVVPEKMAFCPSCCSILINWLYFAVLSPLEGAPDFICPAFVATARSDMKELSVSPDLWLITVP